MSSILGECPHCGQELTGGDEVQAPNWEYPYVPLVCAEHGAVGGYEKDWFYCQDCGDLISFNEGTAYVTASGDVFCRRCGREYDEAEEAGFDDDADGWDFYNEAWYDPSSPVSELEPEDTPRVRFIGEGSEYEGGDS